MPGDWLDLVLLVVIAAFAVAGYRQGFIIGVFSLVGFLAGVAVGALIAPGISRALAKSTSWQAFLAILVVFVMAVVGMLVASGIGVALRSHVIGRPATFIDSVGGAAVNVVAVVIVAWIIGSFVMNSPAFPAVAKEVDDSAVLRTVDGVMPKSVLYLPFFPQLESLLHSGLYTPVIDALGADANAVPQPTSSSDDTAAQATAERSVVKVTGTATSCSQVIEGSGFVISPHHVLTNAHVVAGVDKDLTVTTEGGVVYAGTVVLYDPNTDIAVLYVPGLQAAPLQFAGQAAFGTPAAVVGYPEDHPLTVRPASIGGAWSPSGPNIYETASVTRQMYTVRADIEPGNSGGPLLSESGQVYGVVFAASTTEPDVGYALTAKQVGSDASTGSHDYAAVSTQACQDG